MLPGFRFLIMTILLATSVLIFGLGAAALLRATHEEFASMPTLRTLQQQLPATFAERFNPAPQAILAMVRVDPPAEATAGGQNAPEPDNNTKIASLDSQPDEQALQVAQNNPPAVTIAPRKRLSQSRKPRIRTAARHKRLIGVRRIVPPPDGFPSQGASGSAPGFGENVSAQNDSRFAGRERRSIR